MGTKPHRTPPPFEYRNRCVNAPNHTPHPKGQLAHAACAERMQATHTQEPCPGCGYYVIWVLK